MEEETSKPPQEKAKAKETSQETKHQSIAQIIYGENRVSWVLSPSFSVPVKGGGAIGGKKGELYLLVSKSLSQMTLCKDVSYGALLYICAFIYRSMNSCKIPILTYSFHKFIQ